MRKITREKVMKLLYTMDVYRQLNKEQDLSVFFVSAKGNDVFEQQYAYLLNEKDEKDYFDNTFNGIIENLSAIDTKIQQFTKKTWSIAQFGFVERAILRVAVFELYWSEQEDLTPQIVIATALELANQFTDEKSVKFIHGILGAMVNELEVPTADKKQVNKDSYQKMDADKKIKNKEALRKFNQQKRKQKFDERNERIAQNKLDSQNELETAKEVLSESEIDER